MSEPLYKDVATDLERKIVSGDYKVGTPLPSERTLAAEYKISRNTLREAMKILREKGLIQNLMGKGNYISLPTSQSLIEKVSDAFYSSRISPNDIVDAREDLELSFASHIMAMPEVPDLTELYDMHKAMEAYLEFPDRYESMDQEFHLHIADLVGNAALKIFYMALNSLISKSYYYGVNNNVAARKSAQDEHLRMLDDLKNRDMEDYRDVVKLHLELFRNSMMEDA